MARINSLNILSEGLSQEDLNAKLGAQTPFGFAIGDGPSNPLLWTAPLDAGQVIVGTSLTSLPVPTTIQGTGGISVNSSSGSIVISGSGTGFSWTVVTGGVVSMSPDTGYIVNGPTTFTFPTLPPATPGQSVMIVGNNANWTITGAPMHILSLSSSTLATTVTGTGYDAITLLCVASNTYVATATMGNIRNA